MRQQWSKILWTEIAEIETFTGSEAAHRLKSFAYEAHKRNKFSFAGDGRAE
jgi:hypothetical protein